ncbi:MULTISPECIES: energy transducer TonB [unclassified Dolichospermum]|uniref:energy transducer TonB n=1 Tax=unclassified Dolichospermum TaxID=2622029 RepID=UPI00144862E7|nr:MULTISPECIES: energy transducer TonB [unclassified Dolichospermum]MTJ19144.1 energy transducer TonB [Dolichospermum sp. UHCC 0299]MTJ40469.1 energy transducer TonB [Dolichospermum sp. UHCC 0406]
MEFSSVTIEQREKEAEALKTFLFFSLIGSLVLHIGILALAINKFFLKFPEVREEPIEVTILETIPQEVNQLPVEIKSLAKTNSGGGGGNKGGGISTPTETALNMIKSSVAPITKQAQLKITTNLISKQSQTLTNREPAKILTPVQTNPIENTTPEPATTPPPVETKPIQKLDENANTLASTQPQVQTKPTKITPLKSETQPNASSNNIPSNSTASTQLPQNKNILGNLGDRSRNSLGTENGTGSGTGVGNGIGNSTGNGTGNGTGNESGNKPKSENTPIATAPKPPIENNSKLNRADCIQCQIKYPDRARQRGIEGNAEVAIDTDSQGNVTRVRLVRSSGDSELDQAAQQAAQEWKLTPTAEGREGVRASVNFAIKGSQRHRKLQERQIQKQRATTKKTPEKATSTSTPIESPQYNQQKITPIITDIPSENTTKQKEESAPSESQQISPPASATTSPTES